MKDTLKQVIHKRCKGQIVAVADERGAIQLCCRKCKSLWDSASGMPFLSGIIMADDMRRLTLHHQIKDLEVDSKDTH